MSMRNLQNLHLVRWVIHALVGIISWSSLGAVANASDEIFPLSEVRVGQVGIWRTVVQGDEIREFKLRILGVVDHFSGPKHPVIIAEALDAEHILSGPVAGMSGSPVYIDGRIVGAYAYGYMWPKEQAVIGITPIEQMLEIFDMPEVSAKTQPAAAITAINAVARYVAVDTPRFQAVPSPLMFGGFSAATVNCFGEELESMGFIPATSPIGGADAIRLDLRPGAPIAGVLMQGDFSAAATGTITWTDGERLLAFGHPFLQSGAVELPLAGAEIITVVRNLQSSFKLANIGPPEGRLFQDRLTGIAGERGSVPPMTRLTLTLAPDAQKVIEYRAELWPHPQFLPLLTAMAVLEGTSQTLYRESEQTLSLDGTLTLADGAVLDLSARAAGLGSGQEMAFEVFGRLRGLIDNSFSPLDVTAVDLQIRADPGVRATVLRSIQVGDARPRPGAVLPLYLMTLDYCGEPRTIAVQVPLSADFLPGQKVELTITDAAGANALMAASRRSANGVGDVLENWRDTRPDGNIYLFVTTGDNLPEIDGQSLPGLPPSIQAMLSAPTTDFVVAEGGRHIRWEGKVPVAGVFSGQDTLSLTLE